MYIYKVVYILCIWIIYIHFIRDHDLYRKYIHIYNFIKQIYYYEGYNKNFTCYIKSNLLFIISSSSSFIIIIILIFFLFLIILLFLFYFHMTSLLFLIFFILLLLLLLLGIFKLYFFLLFFLLVFLYLLLLNLFLALLQLFLLLIIFFILLLFSFFSYFSTRYILSKIFYFFNLTLQKLRNLAQKIFHWLYNLLFRIKSGEIIESYIFLLENG